MSVLQAHYINLLSSLLVHLLNELFAKLWKLCQYVLIIYLRLPPGSVRLRPIKLYFDVYGPALVNQPFPPHKAAVIMVPLTWHEICLDSTRNKVQAWVRRVKVSTAEVFKAVSSSSKSSHLWTFLNGIYKRPWLWMLWMLYIQKHYYKKYYWWKVITYQTYLF